ncbi:hypothetical protein RB594_007153 [Gaeumannomyces avenae]
MTLLSFFAFSIFIIYPCMPPRLLPKEFGFTDTVFAEDAQSVWMSGKYVNKLAAMPSMHFGYSFAIGCVLIIESGFLSSLRRHVLLSLCRRIYAVLGNGTGFISDASFEIKVNTKVQIKIEGCGSVADGETSYCRPLWARAALFLLGVWYPLWILLCIIATGNHYLLDAVAAAGVVLLSYLCNRVLVVFLPVEDWLLWALRLEKPVPTTGWVKRDRGRSIH